MITPLSSQFSCEHVYLNSATVGLPCNETLAAMQTDLQCWAQGNLKPQQYDGIIDQCRGLFAGLVDATADEIAIANQASTSVGLIAAALPPGTKVLAPENDFTSVLFPLMAQQARGIELTLVPLDQLIESISPQYDWVACSIVQSSNGRGLALDDLAAAANAADCRILLDGTQAVGWTPIQRSHWDVLVCGAYKWLLSPRGTAFTAIKPDLYDTITPINANWYAGEAPWESVYGSPLRLASSAKQYDISPAWINWVGTLPALSLINDIGVDAIHKHNVGLANQFCQEVGIAPANSAIVSIDGNINVEKLNQAGITASVRDGALRLSFHLYNSKRDIDVLLNAIDVRNLIT